MKKFGVSLACVLLGILLMPAFLHPPAKQQAERETVNVTVARLLEALTAYRDEFGEWPGGSPPAMIGALRGGNAQRRVFFAGPPEMFSPAGELLDPWGSPLLIEFDVETQTPRIRSPGPNRFYEAEHAPHSDDYRSWERAEP